MTRDECIAAIEVLGWRPVRTAMDKGVVFLNERITADTGNLGVVCRVIFADLDNNVLLGWYPLNTHTARRQTDWSACDKASDIALEKTVQIMQTVES